MAVAFSMQTNAMSFPLG